MPTITNWGGNVAFSPRVVATPADDVSLLELLDRTDVRTIRARGQLHGFNEFVATDDLLIDLSAFRGLDINRAGMTVTAGAGLTVAEIVTSLATQRLALPTHGNFLGQTIAGAISTATHGAGEPSLSHFVVRMRVATFDPETATATIATWREGDPELLAARCAMGLLGIVIEVTLRVVEEHLVEETYAATEDVAKLLEWNRRYPHQYFLWFPYAWYFGLLNRRVIAAGSRPINRTPAADRIFDLVQTWIVRGLALFNKHVALPAPAVRLAAGVYRTIFLGLYGKRTVVGRSVDVMTIEGAANTRNVQFEFYVPLSRTADALGLLRLVTDVAAGGDPEQLADAATRDRLKGAGVWRDLVAMRGTYVRNFPIIGRTVASDDALISPTEGGESWCSIGIEEVDRPAYAPHYAYCDLVARVMLRLCGGRLHWGKYLPGGMGREMRDAYPRMAEFLAVVRRHDPHGRFMNAHLRATFLD